MAAGEDTRLHDLCSKLKLPDSLVQLVTAELQSIQAQHQLQQGSPYSWFVCLLYIINIEKRFPYGKSDPQYTAVSSNFTVSQLLQAANVNIVDFFKLLKQVKEYKPLNDVVLTQLVALEKKYCVTSPLFFKFEKMCEDIFQKEEVEELNGEAMETEEIKVDSFEAKKNLCWTLFVYTKELTMRGSEELVLSFQLLLCCVDYIIKYTPAFQLKSPFDNLKLVNAENPEDLLLLQQLCSSFTVTFDEVKSIMTQYFTPTLMSVQENGVLELPSLTQRYTDMYTQHADINELEFLTHEPHLVTVTSHNNSGNSGTPDRPGTSNSDQVVPQSSSSRKPPDTPVRSALFTVQQLQNLLNSAKEEPSPALRKYFHNCPANPAAHIKHRISEMQPVFMTKYEETMGKEFQHLGSRRFTLAVRLYYRTLESLLKLEEKRLSVRDFSHLLNNSVFHKCLFTVCTEVVLVTYAPNFHSTIQSPGAEDKNKSCSAFPWVLDVFSVKAYDLFKVLDSFIRAEPKLTRDVVKHLQRIENSTLDSLSWQSDSPLLEALVKYEAMLPTIPQFNVTDVNMNNNSSTSQMYLSPMRPRANVKSPLCSVPNITLNSSPSQPARSHSLNLFLNKVCRLAYQRLQTLCNLMALSKDLHHKVWSCVEYVITKKHQLLHDRHLDQILMCSIYAVCKVASELDIKFKTIVATYRYLPHSNQQVYKEIKIEGEEVDTIIIFYNKVFMQVLKNYLMQFSAKPMQLCHSPVPKSPITHNLQASPIFSLPGRDNFFVSPMKESLFKVPQSPSQLTPRTRQLYSFGEGLGSSEKLKEFNASMRKNISSGSKSQKRLKFDQEDAGPSSVSPVMSSDVIVVKRIPSTQTRKSLSFTQ